MEGKRDFSIQSGGQSGQAEDWVKNLEQKGLSLAESLSHIVNTVETVAKSVAQFFDTLKKQKDSMVDIGHRAGEQIRPMTETGKKVIGRSREMGSRLVAKSRENPVPFVIGGIAILGGIALLAYYLSEEEDVSAGRESETFAA
jgi:hypothetical protein